MILTKSFPNHSNLRKLSLGRVVYWGYYWPKGIIKKTLQRGLMNQIIDRQAQRQMEQSVHQLPALIPCVNPTKIYFLSGHRFWYQTCFCVYSLIQQSGIYFRPVIHDDGTLTPSDQAAIRRIFPDAEVIDSPMIEAQLDECLPWQQFPMLRSRRLEYFNLRKLTDIHLNSTGWKLVLDSDMLFFRKPEFLLNWLQHPMAPCYMLDVATAYGYSDALMQQLAGVPIPERINVGICGLQSDAIDWHELEYWCKSMITEEGMHYYQEQAICAMLMARYPSVIAPEADYRLMPDRAEVQQPKAVMHHYVADSKPWYFRYGWRQVLDQSHYASLRNFSV
jgi:hypothetical protein